MEPNEQSLLISGIQHFAFCRRQWALIHVEQQWQENLRTVEGQLLHKKAHEDTVEKRGDLLIVRDMPVFSNMLGIRGACDVVEFHVDAGGVPLQGRYGKQGVLYRPIPIEYKRGKPKEDSSDALQLCAQAMCLEEMLACDIHEGFLYYGETHRRLAIVFDAPLRQRLLEMLQEMHAIYLRGYTPKSKPGAFCRACSLKELCLPMLCKNPSVMTYVSAHLKEVDA
ncbi:CRISPR-associated protein Cas4 [Eubacteriales bacterium OttesenSCG-928-K08]|nr:CRISPR-associated protein Cas4 [Eubacteriales bacterium OttesenSCG-928-K08]